jgi:hypothetical protein
VISCAGVLVTGQPQDLPLAPLLCCERSPNKPASSLSRRARCVPQVQRHHMYGVPICWMLLLVWLLHADMQCTADLEMSPRQRQARLIVKVQAVT